MVLASYQYFRAAVNSLKSPESGNSFSFLCQTQVYHLFFDSIQSAPLYFHLILVFIEFLEEGSLLSEVECYSHLSWQVLTLFFARRSSLE